MKTDVQALRAIRNFPENSEHPELAVEAMQAIAAAQIEGIDWEIVVPKEAGRIWE